MNDFRELKSSIISFSHNNLMRIRDFLSDFVKNRKSVTLEKIDDMEVMISSTSSPYTVYINELEDSYFRVEMLKPGPHLYYKCDEVEGVINLITDLYPLVSNDRTRND